ncbi:hypothetical protein [Paenibacillus sp. MMO-58]|uniref:hypothetical protein n=1 Tax=Paenibacillus sp. MMO-58 TaxID=3081290 RepID=UPI003017D234
MSLCFSYFEESSVFVAADSRVAVKVKGSYYFVTDEYKKIRRIRDKVIFYSGNDVEFAEMLFEKFHESHSIHSIYNLVKKMNKDHSTKYREKYDVELEFVIQILTMERGKPALYFINSKDLKLEKKDSGKGQLYAIGAKQNEALSYCLEIKEKFEGINEAIIRSFEHVADETIGGILNCFIISNEGIREGKAVIKDSRTLRKCENVHFPYSYHCDLRGNLTAHNANISGNINMTGGSISWSSVAKPSYTASEVGARSASWLPTPAEIGAVYNSQTAVFNTLTNNGANKGLYMNGGNLYVNASYIKSGVISADLIDTTNLAAQRIYQKDYPNNYASIGGQFGDLELCYGGENYFTIYNDIDAITFKHYNKEHLRFTSVTNSAHPLGTWDFSGATVQGLEVVARFG